MLAQNPISWDLQSSALLACSGRSSRRRLPATAEKHPLSTRFNKEFKISEVDAREIVELAYLEENPGDLSVWGVVNGITSSAKAHRYAEDRTRVGALAGRILTATVS